MTRLQFQVNEVFDEMPAVVKCCQPQKQVKAYSFTIQSGKHTITSFGITAEQNKHFGGSSY